MRLAILIIIPMVLLTGCTKDFWMGAKKGFDDPGNALRRTALITEISDLQGKIKTLTETKDLAGAFETMQQLMKVQGDLRDFYKKVQEDSKNTDEGAGNMLMQFMIGIGSYFLARGGRKTFGKHILNNGEA